MERLTQRNSDNDINFIVPDDLEGEYSIHDLVICGYVSVADKAAVRLADYEDTGLMPEEVAALKAEVQSKDKFIEMQNSIIDMGRKSDIALSEKLDGYILMKAENERLEAERDAAVEDMFIMGNMPCRVCKHRVDPKEGAQPKRCVEYEGNCFEWRGLEGNHDHK